MIRLRFRVDCIVGRRRIVTAYFYYDLRSTALLEVCADTALAD